MFDDFSFWSSVTFPTLAPTLPSLSIALLFLFPCFWRNHYCLATISLMKLSPLLLPSFLYLCFPLCRCFPGNALLALMVPYVSDHAAGEVDEAWCKRGEPIGEWKVAMGHTCVCMSDYYALLRLNFTWTRTFLPRLSWQMSCRPHISAGLVSTVSFFIFYSFPKTSNINLTQNKKRDVWKYTSHPPQEHL